jgi:hypothetical protein
MIVIPTLRRLKQKAQELKANLGYREISCSPKNPKQRVLFLCSAQLAEQGWSLYSQGRAKDGHLCFWAWGPLRRNCYFPAGSREARIKRGMRIHTPPLANGGKFSKFSVAMPPIGIFFYGWCLFWCLSREEA